MSIILRASELLSKWGFWDGDFDDHLCDLGSEDLGEAVETAGNHAVLRYLVRAHLAPLLPDTELYDIETSHNPIRAHSVRGELIDDHRTYADDFLPIEVHVTEADVLAACAAVRASS